MKKEEFELTVMDSSTKEERNFTVKFKPCSSKKDVLPSERVCLWKSGKTATFIILLILLIATTLLFSCKLWDFVSKQSEIKESTTFTATYALQPEENSEGRSLEKVDINTTKTYFLVPCIAFIVVYAAAVAVLLVLFAKDDSGIKFAKLDELHEIRDKILSYDIESLFSETTDETKTVSRKETDNSTCTKKTTKKIDQSALLNHYMDCLVEI